MVIFKLIIHKMWLFKLYNDKIDSINFPEIGINTVLLVLKVFILYNNHKRIFGGTNEKRNFRRKSRWHRRKFQTC